MVMRPRATCPACKRKIAYINWGRVAEFYTHKNPNTHLTCKVPLLSKQTLDLLIIQDNYEQAARRDGDAGKA